MKNQRKLKILVAGAAVVVAVAVAGALLWTRRATHVVRVSGTIEITDAEVSFKIPGRVIERAVDEGQTVKAGQLVARLDSAELAQEAASRRADAEAAKAALAELEAGSRPEEIARAQAAALQAKAFLEEMLAGSRPQELAAAEAALRRAQAEEEKARLDRIRFEELYNQKIVSTERYDAARTAHESALERRNEAEEQFKLVREGPRQEQIAQARAAWQQAEEQYALVRKGPRREQIDQARARYEQAKQALAVAETRLGYATLTSPLNGLVLSKNIEPGEYVAAGTPVVTVGDLEHPWVRAYIHETDIGRVKVGQKVRVTNDTFPGKVYDGRVTFIAQQAEFTPKNVQTQKERVKLVYRVKVEIDNPHMELKPGMPADAEILLEDD
jgi:HlyD family secretion protein